MDGAHPIGDDAAMTEKHPGGRPSVYTDAIADEICERIADDESLVSICKDAHIPARSTVRLWAREHPEFSAKYARAREDQGHTAADIVGDIRKQVLSGEITPDVGRAAADMAKWEASRRASKNFGEKVEVKHDTSDGFERIAAVLGSVQRRATPDA